MELSKIRRRLTNLFNNENISPKVKRESLQMVKDRLANLNASKAQDAASPATQIPTESVDSARSGDGRRLLEKA